jgi:hypothetical protein
VIGLFRLRRRHAAPPGDTTRAAMPMLPPDIQAAINAVLRDQDDPAHVLDTRKLDPPSRAPAAVASASPPPYLFVVRAGEVLTFVRRVYGSLWAVDASRVEARSTSSFAASRPASEK